MVCATAIGPVNARPIDALIDTGSDETLLDEKLALIIGVDLANAPRLPCAGMGGQICIARFAQVTLRLTDGIEFREWPALVGFVAGLRRSVLGFGGCLQFFTATFHGDREVVDLEINQLYPGT